MRKSYSAEMLLMFFSAMSVMVMLQDGLYILIGAMFFGMTSYFITPILKKATIEEYIEAVKSIKK